MVDILKLQGGHVGDVQAHIEGQLIHQDGGCQAVAVQEADQRNDHGCQAGNGKHTLQQLIHESRLLIDTIGRYGSVHAVAHVVDRIRQVEPDLHHSLAPVDVVRVLQNRKGARAIVPGEQLLVHDVTVDLGVTADSAHVGGSDDLHIGDLLVLFQPLPPDVVQQHLQVRPVLQKHLGIAPHRHDIGGDPHDRVDPLDPYTVRPSSKHGVFLPLINI